MSQIKEYLSLRNSANRIAGYDIARGIAIFLMLIINFKGVLSLNESNPQWVSDVIDFLDRRAAATLVIVSGIGVTLITKNSAINCYTNLRLGSRKTLIDRAIFLFIGGYIFSIIWPADILHFYAVFIILGTLLATRSHRFLITTAVLFWMGSFIQFFEIYDTLQEDQYYNFIITHIINLFFTGYYPVFPWAAFFIIGLLLGRLDLQDNCLRRRLLIIGILLFIGSESTSAFLGNLSESIRSVSLKSFEANTILILNLGWITEIDLTIPTPFSVISGLGSGILVVLAGMSLTATQQKKWVRYMIVIGQNTLTLYIGHIVFLVLICLIFDVSNSQSAYLVVIAAMLCFLLYAKGMSVWIKKFSTGPVEKLMRQFTVQDFFSKKYNKPAGHHA